MAKQILAIEHIECDHIKNHKAELHNAPLVDSRRLLLCINCYNTLKAQILQDVLNEAIKRGLKGK